MDQKWQRISLIAGWGGIISLFVSWITLTLFGSNESVPAIVFAIPIYLGVVGFLVCVSIKAVMFIRGGDPYKHRKLLAAGIGLTLVVVTVVISLQEDPTQKPQGIKVTRSQYGSKWPFIIDQGVVDCIKPSAAVFKHGGITYQLNGTASSLGYKDIRPIWRDNPEIPGLKIDIGPMIQLALKQCD